MLPRCLSLALIALHAGALTPARAASVPPTFRAGKTVAQAPAWAMAELRYLDALEGFYRTFLDKFYHGKLGTPPYAGIAVNGGCDDDNAEGIAIWDRFLMVRHSPEIRKAYVQIWHNVFQERRMPGTNKVWCTGGFDWEHTSELFQLLWGAVELDPGNARLVADNRRLADFLMDDLYDRQTRLLRSTLILNLEGKQLRGEPGDVLGNTVYLNAAFLAFLSTGEEKYRRWALDYGASWNELAAKNGGVFPFYVPGGGRAIPAEWWRGPTGSFDYQEWGLLVSRAIDAWPLALMALDGGDPKHLAGLRALALRLFEGREDGLPATKHDGTGWVRARNGYFVPRTLDHVYSATFDPAVARVIRRYHAAAQKAPAADGAGDEADFLRWMAFTYFGEGDLDLPRARFEAVAARLRERTERVKAAPAPKDGDELRSHVPSEAFNLGHIDGGFWGSWDNGRCGGFNPSPVRYFTREGEPGLPAGVAALVRHVGPRQVTLLLYNANPEEQTCVVAAGGYGQHRFDAAADRETEARADVGARCLRVALPARGLATLELVLTRHAYVPTLNPWVL